MSTTFRELLRRSDPTGAFLFGDRTAAEIEKEVHYMASRRTVQSRNTTPKTFKGPKKRAATPQQQASGGGGAPPKKKAKRVRNRKDKKGKKKGGGGAKENKTPNTPKQPPPSQ